MRLRKGAERIEKRWQVGQGKTERGKEKKEEEEDQSFWSPDLLLLLFCLFFFNDGLLFFLVSHLLFFPNFFFFARPGDNFFSAKPSSRVFYKFCSPPGLFVEQFFRAVSFYKRAHGSALGFSPLHSPHLLFSTRTQIPLSFAFG